MYPSSGAFKSYLRQNHIVISKAEVWTVDQKLATLDIANGSVNIKAKSAIRRTCEITLTTTRSGNSLIPDNDFSLLTPFGNELRLFRGIQFDDGSVEYVPLGVFVIIDVIIKDSNDGVQISITGDDRSLIIARNKWTEPYQLVNGPLEDSLEALLRDRYPDVEASFTETNVTINQVVLGTESNNDPWKDAVEIAELVGYDLFFDANGVAQLVPFPTLDGSTVVASFKENEETIITELTRSISTRETYNGVIYIVEGSEVPVPIRVEVWDEDTTSPTFRFGKFGEVPIFVNTNLLRTEAEAITAASSLLNLYIGAQEQISWTSLVDPTLDVQDVVYVKTNGAKVDRVVILDSLTIPLSPESSMSAVARTVRVVATGEEVVIGQ
jgi:hypothetical protein